MFYQSIISSHDTIWIQIRMVSFLFVIYKKKSFYEAHRQEITIDKAAKILKIKLQHLPMRITLECHLQISLVKWLEYWKLQLIT